MEKTYKFKTSTEINGNLRFIITTVLMVTMITFFMYRAGYRAGKTAGFHEGASKGINCALDTVKKILYKQLDNDSCATKLIFDGDTTSYVLTKKTLIENFNQE